MNNINNTQPTSGQVTKTTQFKQSREVETTTRTLQETNARTTIAEKTTIRRSTEITRTRRELEARINELNKQLDEQGDSNLQFRLTNAEQPSIQLIDPTAGKTFDLKGEAANLLATSGSGQNGLLIDISA